MSPEIENRLHEREIVQASKKHTLFVRARYETDGLLTRVNAIQTWNGVDNDHGIIQDVLIIGTSQEL
jgi:hypothetical protein